MAHVDDALATGSLEDLKWLQETLSAVYDLKHSIMGPDHEKEGKFLKRTLKWEAESLTWTADARHAEAIVAEWSSKKIRKVALPLGVRQMFLLPDG